MDQVLYNRLIPAIEKEWRGPFSSWLDYVATCWLQDACDGCRYAEEEGQEKVGLGKVNTGEERS